MVPVPLYRYEVQSDTVRSGEPTTAECVAYGISLQRQAHSHKYEFTTIFWLPQLQCKGHLIFQVDHRISQKASASHRKHYHLYHTSLKLTRQSFFCGQIKKKHCHELACRLNSFGPSQVFVGLVQARYYPGTQEI